VTAAHADALATAWRAHGDAMDLCRWIDLVRGHGWSAARLREALASWFDEGGPPQAIVRRRGREIRIDLRAFASGSGPRKAAALRRLRSALLHAREVETE
jgi:hypothetical protein